MISQKDNKKHRPLSVINILNSGTVWMIAFLVLLCIVLLWPKLVLALLVGAIVVIIVAPLAQLMTRWSLDCADAAALITIILAIAIFSITDLARPIFSQELRITSITPTTLQIDSDTSQKTTETNLSKDTFNHFIHDKILSLRREWHSSTKGLFAGLVTCKWKIVLILLLSQILTVSANSFRRKFFSVIPNMSFEFVAAIESNLSKRLSAYLFVEFGHSLLMGTLITIALKLLGFPYPLSYGTFAALAAMIPRWGAILGMALPAIESVISTGTGIHLIGLVIAFAATSLFCHALFDQALRQSRPNLSLILHIILPILGVIIAGLHGMLLVIPFISVFRVIWIAIDDVVFPEFILFNRF